MLRLRAALQQLLTQRTAPAAASGGGCLSAGSMPTRRAAAPAPCVFFLRGHCRRGDYCAYSHSAPAADLTRALPFADRQFSEVGSAATAPAAVPSLPAAAAALVTQPAPLSLLLPRRPSLRAPSPAPATAAAEATAAAPRCG